MNTEARQIATLTDSQLAQDLDALPDEIAEAEAEGRSFKAEYLQSRLALVAQEVHDRHGTTEALGRLYADWQAIGGPAPDTRDEIAAVAQALGFDPVVAHAAASDCGPLSDLAEATYDVAETGATISEIAAVITEGLKAWALKARILRNKTAQKG